MGMQNHQIAGFLAQVADLLEFQGANPFRTRAYRHAARAIGDLAEPVTEILADGDRRLNDLPGIGKDLAEKVATLVETGSLPLLDELLAEIPESVLALLRIAGLGPKKAAVLYRELGIQNLDQLRAACQEGQVRQLKGFGPKSETTILAGIDLAAQAEQRTRWAEADAIVTQLLDHLGQCQAIRQLEPAGSYRRGRETVGDLDLLVDSDDAAVVMDHLAAFPGVAQIIARGDTKMSLRLDSNLQVDLRVVPTESFGAALQYFTGSQAHNVVLRGLAKKQGLKVNEWGVFRIKDEEETYLAGASEQEVYATLGLPWFPPELREARQEFDWAASGELPKLIELADIRGDLHMHTNATDGRASLREMIAAAVDRGLEYIAVTDHSQRVSMAGGLTAERLLAQWAEIDRINQQAPGIVVLKGIECDILEPGGMDLPDDVLAQADWVVASVHYGQNQSQQQITDRIVGALANPHVDAIAHPTGRLINRRKPYEVDLEAVFQAAVEHGKMLELNANPARLDLDDVALAAARRHGIPIVVNTDAHGCEQLDVMRYGVLQARRGGLTRADVANARPWNEFQTLLG